MYRVLVNHVFQVGSGSSAYARISQLSRSTAPGKQSKAPHTATTTVNTTLLTNILLSERWRSLCELARHLRMVTGCVVLRNSIPARPSVHFAIMRIGNRDNGAPNCLKVHFFGEQHKRPPACFVHLTLAAQQLRKLNAMRL